ncbi:sugar phosphate nucleotidyltransferase [Rickettsiales bacterium]|nr:sugar phosphate nucleotidyltransferase [Rickettsiales bacterium]
MELNQAFIFAAGEGKRMMPLTKKTPKPLLKINNKEIISYSLDKIYKFAKINKIIINAYYLHEKIAEFINQQQNSQIKISLEKSKIETGGGLVYAKDNIDFTKPLLIINGDIIWQEESDYCEISYLFKAWQDIKKNDNNCKILLGLKNKNDLFGYDLSKINSGDFDLEDKNLYFFDNKPTKYVYTGLAIIDPQIINNTPNMECFSFSYFIKQNIMKNGLLPHSKGVELKSKFFHIGDYLSYNRVQDLF